MYDSQKTIETIHKEFGKQGINLAIDQSEKYKNFISNNDSKKVI